MSSIEDRMQADLKDAMKAGPAGERRKETIRFIRAAIHNARLGKAPEGSDPPATLAGRAAYLCMTDPELGRELLESMNRFKDYHL